MEFSSCRVRRRSARTQGPLAIADQEQHHQRQRPERRVFPAAAGIGETEAIGAVHGDDGAQQQRHSDQADPARVDAQQQRGSDHQFDADGEVTEHAGQAQRLKERRRTGRGEHQQLGQRMDQEQHAQGQAQQGGAVRGQRRNRSGRGVQRIAP
ncbi:hypothetical protein G6F50_013380 [Rhizopus delemar]|uniref:Uncharacterized protein n=1 Tax=Rhizopus delemar TaxID=936053 RepID=A0A9P6YI59_9FUNG|nr:hypothetical protein G6F50_013380 [Rhizopus delemar]